MIRIFKLVGSPAAKAAQLDRLLLERGLGHYLDYGLSTGPDDPDEDRDEGDDTDGDWDD